MTETLTGKDDVLNIGSVSSVWIEERCVSLKDETATSERIYCTAASGVLTASLPVGFCLLHFRLSYYIISHFPLSFFILETSDCLERIYLRLHTSFAGL